MASAVSPRSELKIRCALGIMVGRPPGRSCDFSRLQPYSLEISLSRAEEAEKGAPAGLARGAANSPLLWHAQRAVIRSQEYARSQPGKPTIRDTPDARND